MIDIKENRPEMPVPARYGRGKKFVFWAIVVVFLFVVLWNAWVLAGSTGSFPPVPQNAWQAVFLNNNQVYFGRLVNVDRDFVALTNIFYLRVAGQIQQGATTPGPTLNLVKLGGELHGPQDVMYIPKSQLMFWENMTTSSQVVAAINNYYAAQPK